MAGKYKIANYRCIFPKARWLSCVRLVIPVSLAFMLEQNQVFRKSRIVSKFYSKSCCDWSSPPSSHESMCYPLWPLEVLHSALVSQIHSEMIRDPPISHCDHCRQVIRQAAPELIHGHISGCPIPSRHVWRVDAAALTSLLEPTGSVNTPAGRCSNLQLKTLNIFHSGNESGTSGCGRPHTSCGKCVIAEVWLWATENPAWFSIEILSVKADVKI